MDQDNSWALGEGVPMYRVTVETTNSKTVIEVTDDIDTETVSYEVILPVITAMTFMPSQLKEIAKYFSELAEMNTEGKCRLPDWLL